jgi:V/A-type H+-transporting ATPase subunit E
MAMTGLDKILKHIEEDASIAAEAVIAQARKKADEITTAAKAEGEKLSAQILEKSKTDVKAYISRGESAALLQEKKLILNAKQQIIGDTIEKAKQTLKLLPSNEYFDVIVKMVKRHALGLSGTIIFSASDQKRLPAQFESVISKALSDKNGASLTISERTMNIDGGFVLVYDDVEENCSFDALFAAAKEELQDKVSALLFE